RDSASTRSARRVSARCTTHGCYRGHSRSCSPASAAGPGARHLVPQRVGGVPAAFPSVLSRPEPAVIAFSRHGILLLLVLADRPPLVLARPTFSRPCRPDLLSSLPTRPPDGSSTRVSKTARRGRHVGRTVVCNWTGPGWCSNTRSIPAVGWRY